MSDITDVFNQTGLPLEGEIIFRAFNAYLRTGPKDTQPAVNTAKVLQRTGASPETIALSFLARIDEAAYGVLSRRFGTELMAEAAEANLHQRTGFAWMTEASNAVQQIAAATAVASLETFNTGIAALAQQHALYSSMGAATPQSLMPAVPEMKFLGHVAKNKTGLAALDEAVLDSAVDFYQTRQEKMESVGGEAPAPVHHEAFKDTTLPQEATVKRAYDLIAYDPRVGQEAFDLALGAALLLAASPATNNPASIAATLVDVGLGSRTKDDLPFLKNKLDWDVAELLERYSVNDLKEVSKAPDEFRHGAMAWSILSTAITLRESRETFEMLEKSDSPYAPFLKNRALARLKNRLAEAKAIGTEDKEAKILQDMMQAGVREAQEFVDAHAAKPVLALPAPKPKTPEIRPGGTDL